MAVDHVVTAASGAHWEQDDDDDLDFYDCIDVIDAAVLDSSAEHAQVPPPSYAAAGTPTMVHGPAGSAQHTGGLASGGSSVSASAAAASAPNAAAAAAVGGFAAPQERDWLAGSSRVVAEAACAKFCDELDPNSNGPFLFTRAVVAEGGFAVPIKLDFVNGVLSWSCSVSGGKATLLGQSTWERGVMGNRVLAEVLRLHLHKLSQDRVPPGLIHPKDCLAILCHTGVHATEAKTVQISSQDCDADCVPSCFKRPDASSWQQGHGSLHFRVERYCQVPSCTTAQVLAFTLPDLMQPMEHEGTKYVWLRVFWCSTKERSAPPGSSSSSSTRSHGKKVDMTTLGKLGCSCAFTGQGGAHVQGISYGVLSTLHIAKQLGDSYGVTASQLASQSQLAANHAKLLAGDHTGVITDARAQRALNAQRARMWLTDKPADEGAFEAVKLHHAAGTAKLYDPTAPDTLSSRLELSMTGGNFAATMSSAALLTTYVDVAQSHGLGLYQDFTQGLTGQVFGEKTKVWSVSAPHPASVRGPDEKLQRTKGSRPLIIFLMATVKGTGAVLADAWRRLDKAFKTIRTVEWVIWPVVFS